MHTHTQARCKVHVAGKAASVVFAEELRFDEGRGMITAGVNKMKVSGWPKVVAFLHGCVFARFLIAASCVELLRNFAVSEFLTLTIVIAFGCFMSVRHKEGALGQKKKIILRPLPALNCLPAPSF